MVLLNYSQSKKNEDNEQTDSSHMKANAIYFSLQAKLSIAVVFG
jgi:hypothetical protein